MGAYMSFRSETGGALIGVWALKGTETIIFPRTKDFT